MGNPIKELYEFRHTLVLIPTIVSQSGDIVDFEPTDVETYEEGIDDEYYQRDQRISAMTHISRSAAASSQSGASALNHGSLIPPGR